MTDLSQMPWDQLGYGDIVSVSRVNDEIQIGFGNGEVAHVQPSQLGIVWDEFSLEFDADDGLGVSFVSQSGEVRFVDWMQIRTATDARFAHELRRRDADQSRRLGIRLKALREDRGLNQRDLAKLLGMSSPQLSKIESGAMDLRVSTVQALLRAMGSSFDEIASPEALEVSQKTIRKRAEEAGVGRDLIDRILSRAPRLSVPRVLASAFGWDPQSIANGVPVTSPVSLGVLFKSIQAHAPGESPLVNLALVVADLVKAHSTLGDYLGIPKDPSIIRESVKSDEFGVTLGTLTEWVWNQGIPVVPLIGKGGFCAAVWTVENTPVVVLKEVRDSSVFWLFDLAHELGHIALGHMSGEGIVDVENIKPQGALEPGADQQEAEANQFAVSLLLGEPERVLAEVRVETRSNYLRFKSACADVAKKNNVSPGLLGMIAAYSMTDIGEPKDRWGSATNLAVADGIGRTITLETLNAKLDQRNLTDIEKLLLETAVEWP
jgi:transcriptional regulator with XRE-family HTH domain